MRQNRNHIKTRIMNKGKVDVLLGLQWGDEGKGKVVDVLTPQYDVVARFQGGPNAGHTLEFEGQKYVLRSIPSGIFQGDKVNIIGNGVVLAPDLFMEEAMALEASGHDLRNHLHISKKAHLTLTRQPKARARLALQAKASGPLIPTRYPATVSGWVIFSRTSTRSIMHARPDMSLS